MATMAQRLAELEAQVAELREQVVTRDALDFVIDRAFAAGRASTLSRQATPRPPRPCHLQAVQGGQQ